MAAAPGKISISFGAKPSKSGSSRVAPPRPPKRTQAAFQEDEEYNDAPRFETVSHFDHNAGGAIDINNSKKEKELLVIPAQHKRDWREETRRKRQRSGLPIQEQTTGTGTDSDVLDNRPAQYGLTVRKKFEEEEEEEESQVEQQVEATIGKEPELPSTKETAPTKLTDDELALQALLGGKPKSMLTIPQLSEQEAFERDYNDAPDEPTLDEYVTVPVEEFGDAMLRGMGWKDGEAFGKNKQGQKSTQPKPVEKRPALLGIGAKHDKAVAEELGAWGKGTRGGRGQKQTYMPVLLRNKKTGEMLTEDELKAKMEQEKLILADQDEVAPNSASERDRHRSEKSSRRFRDDDSDDRRRNDRDDRSSKYRSSRRDRSSSADSRNKKRRRDDEYYSSRRDKDYRREEKYDSDRRYKERNRQREDDYDRESRDKDRRRDRDDDYDRRDRDRRRRDRNEDYDSDRKDRERRRRERDDKYDSKRRDRNRRSRDDRDDDYDRRKDSRRDR